MGKFTISMAIVNSFLYVYQAGFFPFQTPPGYFQVQASDGQPCSNNTAFHVGCIPDRSRPSLPGMFEICCWLVVYQPLWKIMEFVSWDDELPNIWKVIKAMFQTTNQVEICRNTVIVCSLSNPNEAQIDPLPVAKFQYNRHGTASPSLGPHVRTWICPCAVSNICESITEAAS